MSKPPCWSSWHARLHRQLLLEPWLLPKGQSLLLAVSGGQDSMALVSLLIGLRHLHAWTLMVWHGDHGWHERSGVIALELADWCRSQGLSVQVNRATSSDTGSEAAARQWRYRELAQMARIHGQDVVTGHTATDRAETMLLQMARGTDLAGLGSLRPQRPLQAERPDGAQLRRPLLRFSRSETEAICRDLNLPVWIDPSNNDHAYARNRIRHQVLPVLDDLHPGSSNRIAELSERVSRVQDIQRELSHQALLQLRLNSGLNRRELGKLHRATRRVLLATWLSQRGVPTIDAKVLDELSHRLDPGGAAGHCSLPNGWRLQWKGDALMLDQA